MAISKIFGRVAFIYKREFNPNSYYSKYDVVLYKGSLYYCSYNGTRPMKFNSPVKIDGTLNTHWLLFLPGGDLYKQIITSDDKSINIIEYENGDYNLRTSHVKVKSGSDNVIINNGIDEDGFNTYTMDVLNTIVDTAVWSKSDEDDSERWWVKYPWELPQYNMISDMWGTMNTIANELELASIIWKDDVYAYLTEDLFKNGVQVYTLPLQVYYKPTNVSEQQTGLYAYRCWHCSGLSGKPILNMEKDDDITRFTIADLRFDTIATSAIEYHSLYHNKNNTPSECYNCTTGLICSQWHFHWNYIFSTNYGRTNGTVEQQFIFNTLYTAAYSGDVVNLRADSTGQRVGLILKDKNGNKIKNTQAPDTLEYEIVSSWTAKPGYHYKMYGAWSPKIGSSISIKQSKIILKEQYRKFVDWNDGTLQIKNQVASFFPTDINWVIMRNLLRLKIAKDTSPWASPTTGGSGSISRFSRFLPFPVAKEIWNVDDKSVNINTERLFQQDKIYDWFWTPTTDISEADWKDTTNKSTKVVYDAIMKWLPNAISSASGDLKTELQIYQTLLDNTKWFGGYNTQYEMFANMFDYDATSSYSIFSQFLVCEEIGPITKADSTTNVEATWREDMDKNTAKFICTIVDESTNTTYTKSFEMQDILDNGYIYVEDVIKGDYIKPDATTIKTKTWNPDFILQFDNKIQIKDETSDKWVDNVGCINILLDSNLKIKSNGATLLEGQTLHNNKGYRGQLMSSGKLIYNEVASTDASCWKVI